MHHGFLTYFFKANVVLIVLGGFYLLMLKKCTFYSLNRIFLLFTIITIFALPLVEFPFDIISQASSDHSQASAELLFAIPFLSGVETESVSIWLYWPYWAMLFLALGFFIHLVRLVIQLISLYLFIRSTQIQHINGIRLRASSQKIGSFSFCRFFCVNPDLYSKDELSEVIAHEQAHIRQLHSFDIILLELFRCVFWVNPVTHIIRKEARQNLEYLADREVVKKGFNSVHYQYTLLRMVDRKILPVIVSEFRMSNLKKRIIMMNKSKTSTVSLLRYSLIIPLFTVLWFYASPALAQDLNKKEKELNEQKNSTPSTITIKGIRGKMDKVNFHVGGDSLLINSANAPLIIIDGVEAVGEVRLDPSDIKSMSVLKGENVEEIYGEKGSNGVVLFSLKEDNSENDGSEAPLFSEKENEKISSNNPPLIIVDGVEATYENIKKIATEDVESISVLKDEEAEKMYGEKGKKGVIIIKTRQ